MLTSKWTGDGLEKMQKAVKALSSKDKSRNAYRMALNDTNDKVYTQVMRAVALQVGVGKNNAIKYGGIKKVKALNSRLVATIKSDGAYLPLSTFKPAARRKGVTANPWSKTWNFPGTFRVASIGNHVFKRTDKWNKKSGAFNAIEKVWGPSVPQELVRNETEQVFQSTSSKLLPAEVERQLKRLPGGIIT